MAVYKHVSCRVILFGLNDRFNLKGSDLEVRAIEWIGKALTELNLVSSLQPCHEDLTISSYRATLPCDVRYVRAFEVDGKHYDMTKKYNVNKHDVFKVNTSGIEESYELNRNNMVVSSREDGTIRIHYLKAITEFDDELQMELPMIPDDETLHEALLWNVLYKWLGRGNNHPVYSLGSQKPHLDPYLLWLRYKPKAKNSVNKLSRDERDLHKELWNTLIVNRNANRTRDFLNI